MCGAPVFPAIPTPFVYRPQAAAPADVTNVALPPPPSTPSLDTSAPPHEHDTLPESYAALLSRQQLMAEATRELLAAAQQQMARPDRQASAKVATRGAPVPPPIKMRFVPNTMPAADVYRPQAAVVDVTDVGSPPPSTPPGSCSSLETGAPPHDTLAESYAAALLSQQQQQLMAGATRGLLAAAAQQMARPDRQQVATRGARVASPIKMRFVVPNTMPAPAADVMDAGSSAPSTPSPSRCSSSLETTPSPRGPLPPSLPDPAAACASHHPLTPGAAWGLATKPPMVPVPFPPARPPAPHVEVRQVWAHNFEQEAKLIESLLPKFRYLAVDTKFPGTVYRPAGPAHTLKPEERYKLLRSTVDALDPIQLGLTLFDDAGCRLPSLVGLGDGATAGTRYVWEFNFREFDVRRHRHTPESIAALRARGVDLDRTRRDGVDAAAAFGPRLRKWARAGLGRAGVVTASGGYDLAYLVKMMLGPGFRMPASAAEFEVVAGALLRRRRVFDVREMARLCPSDHLRRGLDSVAAKLNVARAAGEAHQAGYDSLLTCYTFVKLREICFDDDGKLTSVDGILAEITAL